MALNRHEMLETLVRTGLYVVTLDEGPSDARLRAVEQALIAGARVVQLRDKATPKRALLEEARAMRALCAKWGAVFIVNDDAALAWCCDADGLHLGQDDLPVTEARRLLGPDRLIGLSTHAVSEAREADELSADYLGVGAVFATLTKKNARLRGVDLVRRVREATRKPLVAIGGIDASNAAEVFEAGADAVAVVRGIFDQGNVAAATSRLLEVAAASKRVER